MNKKQKSVPREVQEAFYKIASEKMEAWLELGMLSNRFGLRSFAIEMMCKGYFYKEEQGEKVAKRQGSVASKAKSRNKS